jgi:hypothetical protein
MATAPRYISHLGIRHTRPLKRVRGWRVEARGNYRPIHIEVRYLGIALQR